MNEKVNPQEEVSRLEKAESEVCRRPAMTARRTPPDQEVSFYRAFGCKLRKVRVESELSQERLAGMLGWNRTSICNIESGRQRVLAHDVERIARIFGVTVRSLWP